MQAVLINASEGYAPWLTEEKSNSFETIASNLILKNKDSLWRKHKEISLL